MKAGLHRVPKFEEILGNGTTYDLDERLRIGSKAATNFKEGFFYKPAIELLDEDHDAKHAAVLGALQAVQGRGRQQLIPNGPPLGRSVVKDPLE